MTKSGICENNSLSKIEMKIMMVYVVINGFKNLRYAVPFSSIVNFNPRKLTLFGVLD
ncbi:MAG: hypothetical protein OEY17_06500 [Nitrosopumilus sp.]|nr:hypothetical protein [Nitrosopumilus sp.]